MNNESSSEEGSSGDTDVPLKRFKCSERQWNDWKWQLKNRIRTVDDFNEFFPEEDISNLNLKDSLKIIN
jgi:hypothetical protein